MKSHLYPPYLSKANLEDAYFTNTILQAKNLKGAILTEALLPSDAIQKLCEREDVFPGHGVGPRLSVPTSLLTKWGVVKTPGIISGFEF